MCRECRSNRNFLEGSRIISVLDKDFPNTHSVTGNTIRVNWLELNKNHDMNRVEIGHVSDYDVERFMIKIADDTDELRLGKLKNRQLECIVSRSGNLSPATFRMLDKYFQTRESD